MTAFGIRVLLFAGWLLLVLVVFPTILEDASHLTRFVSFLILWPITVVLLLGVLLSTQHRP